MKHKQNLWRTLGATACLGLPLILQAQTQPKAEPVGYVKTVTGDASVTTAGQRLSTQPGTPVLLGSQLKTAKGASMGIAFKDNTLMSFGSDTELTVHHPGS